MFAFFRPGSPRPRWVLPALIALVSGLLCLYGLLRWETDLCLPAAEEAPLWLGVGGVAAVLTLLAAIAARVKKAPFLLSARSLGRLFLLALFFNLCANPMFCVPPLEPQVALVMGAGSLCVLWALLGRASLIFWVPFIFIELAQIAAFFQYGTRFNSLVLAESMEASEEEVMAYLSLWNVVLAVLALLFSGFMGWVLCRGLRPQRRLTLLGTGSLFCLLATLMELTVPATRRLPEQHLWPVSELVYLHHSYAEAVEHNIAVVNLAEGLSSPALEPSSCEVVTPNSGIVFIIHIGESMRADAMSINGYERDTTPWLRCQPRVINFPDCISSAADTCQAEIVLLTNARRNLYDREPGMQPTTGSVLDLLYKHGFEVYSFFGRRSGQQLKYDRVVRVLTRISKERFNAPGSPWTAVPQIEAVIREHPHDNLAFFINNEGSHTPFSYYDKDNPPFTPADTNFQNPEAHAQEVRNAYDNTIHYTDEYWRRVCELLKGRPFVYIYVSDHGEYLGQDGIWGRGGLGDSAVSYHKTTGCRVGMFVLTSPEFEALHPHFAEALRQLRAHSRMTVAHEHLFHTVLGLLGIETPFYAPELDLCNPAAQPYDGEQPDAPAPGSERAEREAQAAAK